MATKKIQKRDGRIVNFDEQKITDAITKAFDASLRSGQAGTAARLAAEVTSILEVEGIPLPGVEHVQDLVERVLMDNGFNRTAKAYILYRNERTRARNFSSQLMCACTNMTYPLAQEGAAKRVNPNMEYSTPMDTVLCYGSGGAKAYYETYVLNPEFARTHDNGAVYTHDLDFYTFTTACTQIDVLRLLHGGFTAELDHLRESGSSV